MISLRLIGATQARLWPVVDRYLLARTYRPQRDQREVTEYCVGLTGVIEVTQRSRDLMPRFTTGMAPTWA